MEKLFNKPEADYIRTTTITPELAVGDCTGNVNRMLEQIAEVEHHDPSLIVLPELAITGYTAGDLFHNDHLLRQSNHSLERLAEETQDINASIIVGAPIQFKNKLYNCAIVMHRGEVQGIVPKQYLPNYNEFYEQRWFASGKNIVNQQVDVGGLHDIPFGTDLLFDNSQTTFGVEICEDLWAPQQPSQALALGGAEVIVNISASNELIGKTEYRRELASQQAARLICAYVYCSAGPQESTADTVFSGHNLIAENGHILAESNKLVRGPHAETTDIDRAYLNHDRMRNTSFGTDRPELRTIRLDGNPNPQPNLIRSVDPYPFVPQSPEKRDARVRQILELQANGLATQMEAANIEKAVIGLSGGLDSTLALMVTIRAFHLLGKPVSDIMAVTMPADASSERTQTNAVQLAQELGVSSIEIPIASTANSLLNDIGHNEHNQDVTFENTQARLRTSLLMNLANKHKGLVVGTGDMSEIALGWCTFNGDHMSMYNVNSGVPKTLVRHIVAWCAEQEEFQEAQSVLNDILATPISPELVGDGTDINQSTENIIGPFELHDFFITELIRHGSTPNKIGFLACQAFGEKYSEQEIANWLKVFLERFSTNQFKRESQPNGPKVGTVSLSQRADLRLPPNLSGNWFTE